MIIQNFKLLLITTVSVTILLLSSNVVLAQSKPTELDKSPMDISYLPKDYPLLKMNGKSKDQPIARIIYSRPQKSGREIFGNLIPYNSIWRLGANEATEIEFFKNVKIDGKAIPKGRYTLFCIPTENDWILIINKDNYAWGSFNYDSKKDVLRASCTTEKTQAITEALTIYFESTSAGANIVIMWDNLKASTPISW
ncbi:MAG: DUF2911 domain-containing protein [Chitinophagaceae bacterium]|nr:DUF2911 domain-containing protein [Chitinophagaceae bacterium]MCW5904328.1 DUF2911 domain-containing protein [Chitinophagaceae bacterium]